MILHLLINSPYKIDIGIFFQSIRSKDIVLGLQDGVLISIKNNMFLDRFIKLRIKMYVLEEDVLARGLRNYISVSFSLINYYKFVILTKNNKKYITW